MRTGYAGRMLYLASQSPRRRQLLQQLDIDFRVLKVDVPERRGTDESPIAYVERVSRDKARAGLARVEGDRRARVLAADTEVVLGGTVFGKPVDAGAAADMLERLSGRVHEAISVVWLVEREREACARCVSRVTFATLARADIDAYVATGEPFGKAGGYAIQGRAAAFITHLEGSYSGVMGLPLRETATLLRRFGA